MQIPLVNIEGFNSNYRSTCAVKQKRFSPKASFSLIDSHDESAEKRWAYLTTHKNMAEQCVWAGKYREACSLGLGADIDSKNIYHNFPDTLEVFASSLDVSRFNFSKPFGFTAR